MVLRIGRDNDHSIGLTGVRAQRIDGQSFQLLLLLCDAQDVQPHVDACHVQMESRRDDLQRLGHCMELNRIWASQISREPLIRKEYDEPAECLEALDGFRIGKVDEISPVSLLLVQAVEVFQRRLQEMLG